jgi:hypothetical protein
MSRGIEVTIHDTEELQRQGATLEQVSRPLRWLGAKVFVDTAGTGSFVLKQLRADGVYAWPLEKGGMGTIAQAHRQGYELGRKHAAEEYAEHSKRNQLNTDGLRGLRPDQSDPYQMMGKQQQQRLDILKEAVKSGMITPGRMAAEPMRNADEQLSRKDYAVDQFPNWQTPDTVNERLKALGLKALEQKIEAAQCTAKEKHTETDAQLHRLRNELNVFQRRVSELERENRLHHANIATLSQRVQTRAIVSVRRERDSGGAVAERSEHVRDAVIQWVHGSGCQLEGQESRADECIECEPAKGEPTRDENGTWHAQPPSVDLFGPLTANAGQPCPRTYPRDPDTAEDPCEDCGRDQRKHEAAPFEPPPSVVFTDS